MNSKLNIQLEYLILNNYNYWITYNEYTNNWHTL